MAKKTNGKEFVLKDAIRFMFERFAPGHTPTDDQIETTLKDYLADVAPDRRRVQVFQGEDKQWYWRLVGGNGEIMAQSEAYSRKSNAIRGVKDALKIAPDAEVEGNENENKESGRDTEAEA
jgi:uncharacterized protein YegP (UPF0339 family)